MISMRNDTSGILLVNKFVRSSPIINVAAYYVLITETNEPQQTHNNNATQNRWVSAKVRQWWSYASFAPNHRNDADKQQQAKMQAH